MDKESTCKQAILHAPALLIGGIIEVESELAFVDLITDVLGGIGRGWAEVDIMKVDFDISIDIFFEWIDFAGDLYGGKLVELSREKKLRKCLFL